MWSRAWDWKIYEEIRLNSYKTLLSIRTSIYPQKQEARIFIYRRFMNPTMQGARTIGNLRPLNRGREKATKMYAWSAKLF